MNLSNRSHFIGVVLVALALAALRLLYIHLGPLELSPDEAQYWTWSHALDWSYYSKPPLISWLIAGGTTLVGHTELGVRWPATLLHGVISLLGFALLWRWRGALAAWLGFALLQLTPLFAVGGVLMTTDVPSITGWLLALYLLIRVDWEQPSAKAHWPLWLGVGVAVGVAGLAKYSVAVFYPLLFLFLVLGPKRQKWLAMPQPYVAGVVSLLCQLPVLYWNSQNGWVAFKHVAGQASGGEGSVPLLESLGLFFGGQLMVVGPILLILLFVFWLSSRRNFETPDHTAALLWWFSAPIFIAFLWLAIGGSKVQANWPVLGMLAGMLGTIGWVTQRTWGKWIVLAALVLNLPLTIGIHNTELVRTLGIKLPPKNDPLKPLLGWNGLGSAVGALSERVGGDVVYLTPRYQTTAALSFYIPGQPQVLYLNPGSKRQNHYDYVDWPELNNRSIVMFITEGQGVPANVINGFRTCQPFNRVASTVWERVYKQAELYLCTGYRGIERTKADTY